MKISELLDDVRILIGDTNKQKYSDISLISRYNEAIRDVAKKTNFFRGQSNLPHSPLQREYNLPTDCFTITRLVDMLGKQLHYMSHNDMDKQFPGWKTKEALDEWDNQQLYAVYDLQDFGHIQIWPVFSSIKVLYVGQDDGVLVGAEGYTYEGDAGVATGIVDTSSEYTLVVEGSQDEGALLSMIDNFANIEINYSRIPERKTEANLDDDIELPYIYLDALKYYMAAVILTDDNSSESQTKASMYASKYTDTLIPVAIGSARDSTKDSLTVSFRTPF